MKINTFRGRSHRWLLALLVALSLGLLAGQQRSEQSAETNAPAAVASEGQGSSGGGGG